MSSKQIVRSDYNGTAVSFTESGWFNATEAAAGYGKRPNDWLATDETKAYLSALEQFLNTSPAGNSGVLIATKRGRGGGTWLHPKLAVAFARWLDPAFGVWCDFQIDDLIRGKHVHYDWKRVRHEAASSFKVTMSILQLSHRRDGKEAERYHYANEARLINFALTGEFCSVDREALPTGDLDLLAKLENMDSVLIGSGASYDERKSELQKFAAEQRVKLRLVGKDA